MKKGLNLKSKQPTSEAVPGESARASSEAFLAPSDGNIPPPGQYCVYAILCDDNSLYIGYTNDLSRRWREHQSGSAARWTKKHKPQRIAYYELAPSRQVAIKMRSEE